MVVTLEELLELSLAGRTLSSWPPGDIWKLTAGLAPYFRAMSNTRTSTSLEEEGANSGWKFCSPSVRITDELCDSAVPDLGHSFSFLISLTKCLNIHQFKSRLTIGKT